MGQSNSGEAYDKRVKVAEYFVEKCLIGVDGYKQALRHYEYTPQTINMASEKMFNKPETARLIAEARKRKEFSVDKAIKLLESLQAECESSNDRTNKLAVIKELSRLNRLYEKDGTEMVDQVVVSNDERRKTLMRELELLDKIDKVPLAIAE